MGLPPISPPLLNSSNPWATTKDDLQALYDCTSTGAVTVRTSLLDGFPHDDNRHQYTFFEPGSQAFRRDAINQNGNSSRDQDASLNTLGYSPILLSEYLSMLPNIHESSTLPAAAKATKPIIISVTGTADEVVACYERISTASATSSLSLCMEINLSCPNIADKPPPAYSRAALSEYLLAMASSKHSGVPVGIKTPPYTYIDQFRELVNALVDHPGVVDFITATNTLGSSLVVDENGQPALGVDGIGGMAGAPLHALALGNVKILRGLLDKEGLGEVDIIGVGGVADTGGYQRMRAVGAKVVGVGTALGKYGLEVFGTILQGQ